METELLHLTKQSEKDLCNQHNGTGVMFVKLGSDRHAKVYLHLGKNNKWYTGKMLLSDYLKSIVSDVEVD